MADYPALPKWPALLVAGEPVTADQAAEILVRTCPSYLFANDKAWLREVKSTLGIPSPGDDRETARYGSMEWEAEKFAWRALGHIGDLNHLHNNRIVSTWIGGSYGWCDWDGTIGCANYNIGKWPSVEEVRDDWAKIAAAFPYLQLRAQLMSGETCEEDAIPLIEYTVARGEVQVSEPAAQIRPPVPVPDSQIIARMVLPGGERGCTPEQLRHAVQIARVTEATP